MFQLRACCRKAECPAPSTQASSTTPHRCAENAAFMEACGTEQKFSTVGYYRAADRHP